MTTGEAGLLVVNASVEGVLLFLNRRHTPAQCDLTALDCSHAAGGIVVLGEHVTPGLAEVGAAEAIGQGDGWDGVEQRIYGT